MQQRQPAGSTARGQRLQRQFQACKGVLGGLKDVRTRREYRKTARVCRVNRKGARVSGCN
jgi:hypothetical protein